MTTAAVAMKRLLVGHNRRIGAAFKLDLRNLRQQLRLGIGPCMAIATDGAQGVCVLGKQVQRHRGGPIGRPNRFVWRMLEGFGRGLRSVMAIYTSELSRAVNTAVLSDVIEVVELDRPKFRIRTQRYCLRRFLSVLSRYFSGDCRCV
jgi:hypothetical protein